MAKLESIYSYECFQWAEASHNGRNNSCVVGNNRLTSTVTVVEEEVGGRSF